ncbi:hypothetical protein [Streptomyces sp. NPDC005989]|uniref:hypothetical protein n=1 Tax=Streptomyces sp. NPDC005989 TaxID=3156727 RepID=UPI0033F22932
MVNGQDDVRRADALAYLCAELPVLRSELRAEEPPDGMELLDRLADAVANGADAAPVLGRIHGHLQDGGDLLGLYGRVGHDSTARGLHPGGVARSAPGASAETVYLCPARSCSRYFLPSGGDPVPRCLLTDQRLIRETL